MDQQTLEIAEVFFLMRKFNWNSRKVCRCSGIDEGHFSKMLSLQLRPTPQVAARIASAFGKRPSEIFKSMFSPTEFDPMWQTEIPRSSSFQGKNWTDLDRAKVQFLRDENALSESQCRILAQAMGDLPPWRIFPERFSNVADHLGRYPAKKPAGIGVVAMPAANV